MILTSAGAGQTLKYVSPKSNIHFLTTFKILKNEYTSTRTEIYTFEPNGSGQRRYYPVRPMAGVVLRWNNAWFIGTRVSPLFLTHHEQPVPAKAHQEDHPVDGVQATSTTTAHGKTHHGQTVPAPTTPTDASHRTVSTYPMMPNCFSLGWSTRPPLSVLT